MDRSASSHQATSASLYQPSAVAFDPAGNLYIADSYNGRVRRVDILNYRESYGGEVHDASWLAQFVGKSSQSDVRVNSDICNISGATLSSTHLAEGVKKVLMYHASHFH